MTASATMIRRIEQTENNAAQAKPRVLTNAPVSPPSMARLTIPNVFNIVVTFSLFKTESQAVIVYIYYTIYIVLSNIPCYLFCCMLYYIIMNYHNKSVEYRAFRTTVSGNMLCGIANVTLPITGLSYVM